MKVAVYVRVSTEDQDPSKQEEIILEYCKRMDYKIYGVYTDVYSGIQESRPQFNLLLEDMRKFKFNAIAVTKLDRIGRSLKHLLSLFDEFKRKGVNFISVTQNINTDDSTGYLLFQIMGAFAEFERNIISERTKEGLRKAKNVGKRGKDKKPRKKRGVLRKPKLFINE